MEVWKSLKGVVPNGDNYAVSTLGKVRNVKTGKVLKGRKHDMGYLTVDLLLNGKGKGYYVHRLIATAFIPNPQNKRTVNHLNGNKTDNRVSNLAWATYSEQQIHAISTGLKSYVGNAEQCRINAKNKGKPVACYTLNGKLVKVYENGQKVKEDGFNAGNVNSCCNGRFKTHGGYIWRFADVKTGN